jgi:hypothetical protein
MRTGYIFRCYCTQFCETWLFGRNWSFFLVILCRPQRRRRHFQGLRRHTVEVKWSVFTHGGSRAAHFGVFYITCDANKADACSNWRVWLLWWTQNFWYWSRVLSSKFMLEVCKKMQYHFTPFCARAGNSVEKTKEDRSHLSVEWQVSTTRTWTSWTTSTMVNSRGKLTLRSLLIDRFRIWELHVTLNSKFCCTVWPACVKSNYIIVQMIWRKSSVLTSEIW